MKAMGHKKEGGRPSRLFKERNCQQTGTMALSSALASCAYQKNGDHARTHGGWCNDMLYCSTAPNMIAISSGSLIFIGDENRAPSNSGQINRTRSSAKHRHHSCLRA